MTFAFYTNCLWDYGLIGILEMPEKKRVWASPKTNRYTLFHSHGIINT
jgi:hypothetical protein